MTYSTLRTRLVLGVPLQNFTPVIGIGNSVYIDNGSTYMSLNVSAGLEIKTTRSSKFRFEAIRDFNPDHVTPVTVIRFGILTPF